MGLLEYINSQLRRFKFIKDYQNPINSSSFEHTGSSIIYSLVISLVACYTTPWLLVLKIPVWFIYAIIKEFYWDRFKNAGRPISEVWAQIMERSIGFILVAPLDMLMVVL